MRKDHLHRRTEGTHDVEVENGDPLQGSADPFDALINSKSDEPSTSASNGKRAPSPIPDESDADNDNEAKNENVKFETNGDSANESAENGGDEEEGFEVEDIVGHKFKGMQKYFKIRWKNYDESADTWEKETDLSCPEIIERYVADHPEANEVKVKKEKKVRISLPPKTPTRIGPKRTAAERKVVDETLSDDEGSDYKKSASKPKRGRSKKTEKSKLEKNQEYEVLKIIDDKLENGKKLYRIRWKGWSSSDDTWEPKASLSCPEIIKAYESNKKDDTEYEVEKIVGEKIEKGTRHFLVKWKGWSEDDNTWESEKAVDCFELIEKFRNSCRSATIKSNKRPATTASKASKKKKARKNQSDNEDDDDDGNDNDGDGDGDDDDGDDDKDAEKEWEVEKVVNVRKSKGGKKEYLIRWKGYKAADDTWEAEDAINCPSLITAFLKKNKK